MVLESILFPVNAEKTLADVYSRFGLHYYRHIYLNVDFRRPSEFSDGFHDNNGSSANFLQHNET